MRIPLLFLSLWLVFGTSYAQKKPTYSDLRVKIDSIIQFEIQYIPDSSTNKLPSYVWDPSLKRGLYASFSTTSPNPMTVILIDGIRANIDDLNEYSLADVDELNVYPKNDPIAMAIHGTSAKNGLIVIITRQSKQE